MFDSLVSSVKCTCVALAFFWFVAPKRNPLSYPPGDNIRFVFPYGTCCRIDGRGIVIVIKYDEMTTSVGATSGLGTYMMLSRVQSRSPAL
ncbi:hypothetical protein EDD17DRAFT_1530784 [Pisolithus thermaeus]|nr:hypothetical protein EV401DRAFT_1947932 [Pisolithus croceorrhizus]KAI6167938.1 hypothetical protein EDD17DRAFT_1530784 [Pisolithus thermaeus]